MGNYLKKATFVVLIVFLSVVVHWTQREVDQYRVIRFVDKNPVFLPKGEVLKWMSLGYRGLVADWLWIQTVLYFGRRAMDEDNRYFVYVLEKGELEDELGTLDQQQSVSMDSTGDVALQVHDDLIHVWHAGQYRELVEYIYPMLDRVTTVDPHFIFPYIFGGVYMLMNTGEFEKAAGLLEKGYKANPDRWELPFYLGWIHWMYQGNIEKTMEYLLNAVSKDGCPQYVSNLLVGLSKNPERSEFTRLYLEGLLQSNDNPEIQEQVLKVLNELDRLSTDESMF